MRSGAQRGRIRVMLEAWCRAPALDRQLAAGANVGSSAALVRRAEKLTGRRSRGQVADGLRRALRSARDGTSALTAAVRLDAAEVLASRVVLEALDRRLVAPEPVSPRGMAMLHGLLTEPASPLYCSCDPGTLGGDLRAAASALEPRQAAR